jgi:hypothetical protein
VALPEVTVTRHVAMAVSLHSEETKNTGLCTVLELISIAVDPDILAQE